MDVLFWVVLGLAVAGLVVNTACLMEEYDDDRND